MNTQHDSNEAAELLSLFRKLDAHERDFLKRAMLGMVAGKRLTQPKVKTAKIYEFKQAVP